MPGSIIENISDTALWVAVFRADENDRPDAVFKDPFARRLAGEHGEKIADAIEFGKKNSWSYVARTFEYDEFIQQHVDEEYDMVINLAAGLDTRPFRMTLPESLKWIDVDLPAIIDYKRSMLSEEKPVCQLQMIALDLSDREKRIQYFNQFAGDAKKILIVSEGLIGYLSDEEAASLAEDLGAHPNFKRWIFDIMSPSLLVMAKKEMGAFLKGDSELKFAPKEGENFFLQYGWKPLACRSKLKTAAKLNRLSEEMMTYAAFPEPEGPPREFPWSGTCLFENMKCNE